MMQIARSRERILPRPIEEEMRESFLDYSMSVIVQRALPDVRDGLKPVHRRILFAMHELGLAPDRSYKKSATVVGDVLGKYHPHGDSAVYDALVRMVQDFSLRYPLVDGQGNFGSIDGDPAAAYRYTEARLSRVAADLLTDIARDTVDWTPNFDDRLQEPVVVPSRLPNLLMNGSAGIAVGMSTNVPPHNLGELVAAIRRLADDDEPTLDELMEIVPGPDFPTGGFIVGRKGIREMYRTGRGRIVMRARVVREKIRGGREQLVIAELPYATSKSKIIAQIAGLSRKGALAEVSNLRDESDRDGVRLVIELKRGADAGMVLKRLFRRTSLQSTFGAILLALDRGEPREFTLKEMLERFRDHRVEVIRRRSQHELAKAEDRAHVLEGMLRALDFIDEVIAIIRSSADRAQAAERLQSELDLTERQAGAILDMQLARLTSLERQKLEDELVGLRKTIRRLRHILSSEYRQLQVMLEELEEGVREFGDARRTTILDRKTASKEVVEAAEADEDAVVTVSHQGFVKRMSVHLYRRRLASGKLLAGMERYPDDYLERLFVARTQGWILAFTEGGHVHFLSVADVPESGLASRGQSLYSPHGGQPRGSVHRPAAGRHHDRGGSGGVRDRARHGEADAPVGVLEPPAGRAGRLPGAAGRPHRHGDALRGRRRRHAGDATRPRDPLRRGTGTGDGEGGLRRQGHRAARRRPGGVRAPDPPRGHGAGGVRPGVGPAHGRERLPAAEARRPGRPDDSARRRRRAPDRRNRGPRPGRGHARDRGRPDHPGGGGGRAGDREGRARHAAGRGGGRRPGGPGDPDAGGWGGGWWWVTGEDGTRGDGAALCRLRGRRSGGRLRMAGTRLV